MQTFFMSVPDGSSSDVSASDRTMNKYGLSIVAVCALAGPAVCAAQEGVVRPNWRIDVSLYPYQRTVESDVDFTLTINGNLPGRFSYFSFNNFKGVTSSDSAVFDRSKQKLYFKISEKLPFDLTAQGVLVRGDSNDFYQSGIRWRISDTSGFAKFFKQITFVLHASVLPFRWGTDKSASDAWVLESFFRLTAPKLSKRLYLSGFFDKTFNEDVPGFMPPRPVIAEVQVGYRVWKQLHMVAEFRLNERRRSQNRNTAAGLEYKFRF